jgi:hypothetical protein
MGKINRPKGKKNMKSRREKQKLLEELRQIPIIQIACQKLNIGRSSFYRWKKDKKFAKEVDKAIFEGSLLINDLAESQLISVIKNQNMAGISFWLKNHHPTYANKLQISGGLKNTEEELTQEQKKIIKEALKIASSKNNG